MAFDTVEKQDIRTLDIDKVVKGFALTEYVFKSLVTVSSTDGDSIRWYQETPGDLTATAPAKVADIAPLAGFTTLEHSWQRNTSFPRKYGVEGFISMEDLRTTDIDVQARTVLRLTRAVVKQVDTRIYDIMSEEQSPSNIGFANAVDGSWSGSSANPILDIMSGQQAISEQNYQPIGGVIAMTPKNHKDLLNYLITTKGSSIPSFAVEKVKSGVVMNLLGMRVVVSNNVVTGSVWMGLPEVAVTWKTAVGTTAAMIEEKGIGIKIRVWEDGEAILTDPKAAYLIKAT